MAGEEDWPFPIWMPLSGEYRTENQHAARSIIVHYQRRGAILPCANATVATQRGSDGRPMFWPACRAHSFVWGASQKPLIGCPQGCHYFEARWRLSLRRRWAASKAQIAAVATWFATLAPIAQALIAFTVLFVLMSALAPGLLRGLLEAWKTLT